MQEVSDRTQQGDVPPGDGEISRAVLDSLSAHICVLDERGVIIAVNRAWRNFARDNGGLGDTLDPGENYLAVCERASGRGGADAARFAAGLREVMSGASASFEMEYSCHAPGERRWFVARVTRLKQHGRPGYVIAHENISGQRLAQIELEHSNLRYQFMIESMAEGVLARDAEGTIIACNRRAEEILGIRAADVLGRAWTDASRRSLREDGSPFPVEEHPTAVTLRTGKPCGDTVIGLLGNDGTTKWIAVHATPLRIPGERGRSGVVTSFVDITAQKDIAAELKESEALFRQAFAHAPIGFAITTVDGRLVVANPALCNMLGYAFEELQGRHFRDVTPAEDVEKEMPLLKRLLAGEITNYSLERRSLHKDGHTVSVIKTVSAARLVEGKPVSLVAQIEDITQRRRAEAENLGASIQASQEAERARLSHELHDELGQALTGLKIFLTRAQRSCAAPIAGACLDQAQEITEGLMREVRAIARRLRPTELDDLGLVPALRSHLDKVVRPAGVRATLLENIGDTRLTAAIELCCFRVTQEALTNTLRHARAGQVSIALTLNQGRLVLGIKDDGTGFDYARYEHDIVHRRSGKLGLIGMRERIVNAGGRLEIVSSPGSGTEVRVEFDLDRSIA